MKSYSSFTFFTLLIIAAKSNAASIPARNSGVLWMTDELPTAQSTNDQKPEGNILKNMAKKLLPILDEMHNIVDLMPADDPNAYNNTGNLNNPPCITADLEASRAYALEYYKAKLMDFMERTEKSTSSPAQLQSSNQKIQEIEPLEDITQKVEERRNQRVFPLRMISIYPLCDRSFMGANTDVMDFIFDLRFAIPDPDTVINITSATLTIYKKPLSKNLAESKQFASNKNVSFIAVYYKNAHSKRDPTKKGTKIAEQTFSIDEERWVEWDIKKAIAQWYNNTSRNSGITLKVADDQIHLPAREFFNIPANCSHIAVWPRLKAIFQREHKYDGFTKNLPVLDLVVLDMTMQELQFTKKEEQLLEGVNVIKQKVNAGSETTTSSTEHKIRHKKNTETSQSQESDTMV